jgi:hypothetical protein
VRDQIVGELHDAHRIGGHDIIDDHALAVTRSAVDTGAVSPPPRNPRDSWLRIGTQVFLRFPLPGQPGHGRTAFVRRRPVRIVDGRMEGGYTDAYELICPSCGDHPYVDYVDVPAQLQWLRGPYGLAAALAAYEEHPRAVFLPGRGQPLRLRDPRCEERRGTPSP